MPQPTRSQVHIDAILTNISVAYLQDQTRFIASKVFPIVNVGKQSDKYFVYKKNDWFRDEAERRADATESAGSGYNLDTDSYACDVWAFHKDVGKQARANADSPLDLDREAAQFVTRRLALRQEIQWVDDFFKPGIWANDLTGVSGAPTAGEFKQWSSLTDSTPIDDIEEGKEIVLGTTGYEPNTLVLGYRVFRVLKNHPEIIDRIKHTSSEVVTTDLLARLFDVDKVLVASAVRATNKEGEAEAYAFAHGNHAFLCYSAPEPNLLAPSAGYIFAWDGVSDGLGESIGTSSFEMTEKKATRIEGEISFDDKLVAADLGYFFGSAVA